MLVFDGDAKPASVTAMEGSVVGLLSIERVHAHVRERPEDALAVIRLLWPGASGR